MTPYDESLQALQQQLMRRTQLQAALSSLHDQLAQLREKEQQLRAIREKEQSDVDKLEHITLSSILYTIASRKEEKLEQERAEAYAAALKHDSALRQIEALEQQSLSLSAQLQALSGTEEAFERALAAKAEALKTENPVSGMQLCRIENKLNEDRAQLMELQEALDAGDRVLQKLDAISREFDSAQNWGTWDLWGGGLLADIAKYDHINDAQERINELQLQLHTYQAELADVMVRANLQIQVDGFLRFADYFFDDIFSSWSVLGKIRDAQNEVLSAQIQVREIQQALAARKTALEQECSTLEQQQRSLLLDA